MALAEVPPSLLLPRPRNGRAPWTWLCNRCGRWYRLGTTRRCLACGYTFCQTKVYSIRQALPRDIPKRKRKIIRGGPCSAEFDFIGWAAWGSYRRTLLKNRHTLRRSGQRQPLASSLPSQTLLDRDIDALEAIDGIADLTTYATHTPSRVQPNIWTPLPALDVDRTATAKETLYSSGKHNCWVHCDYPSECHHTLADALRRREEETACQRDGKSVVGTCWDSLFDALDETKMMFPEDEEMERQWDYESVYAQGKEEDVAGTIEIYEDEEEEEKGKEDADAEEGEDGEVERDERDQCSDTDTGASDSWSSSSDSDESEESEVSED
ncbi:hypothetical protein DL546_006244 [Coniochaeta pulveracea]|uniref:Uncharacterized protein n=1 Tax=Coniochaeta pulveracea TaxID=177199 RepID=A0A420Y7M5_9PEZI|nr:hypothetical protein DL546_006244 [Coniochaeta pulveracea]